jgi:hypothetical protein
MLFNLLQKQLLRVLVHHGLLLQLLDPIFLILELFGQKLELTLAPVQLRALLNRLKLRLVVVLFVPEILLFLLVVLPDILQELLLVLTDFFLLLLYLLHKLFILFMEFLVLVAQKCDVSLQSLVLGCHCT